MHLRQQVISVVATVGFILLHHSVYAQSGRLESVIVGPILCDELPCVVPTQGFGDVLVEGRYDSSLTGEYPATLRFEAQLSSEVGRFANVSLSMNQPSRDEGVYYLLSIDRLASNPFFLPAVSAWYEGILPTFPYFDKPNWTTLSGLDIAVYSIGFSTGEHSNQESGDSGWGQCIGDETIDVPLGCQSPIGNWSVGPVPMLNTSAQETCCIAHDLCYRNGGGSSERKECDEEFAACWEETGLGLPFPLQVNAAPFVVSLFGNSFFQHRHHGDCICKLDPDTPHVLPLSSLQSALSHYVVRHSQCCDAEGECDTDSDCSVTFYDETGWPILGLFGPSTECEQINFCGDGVVGPGEECEPPGDGCQRADGSVGVCSDHCSCDEPPGCGNNVVEPGEDCDPPGTGCAMHTVPTSDGGCAMMVMTCDNQCQCPDPPIICEVPQSFDVDQSGLE